MKPKEYLSWFTLYGIFGIFTEVIFTSLSGKTIKGTSSILMFPIYGSMVFLKHLLKKVNFINYTKVVSCILLAESMSGMLLKTFGLCPWSYSGSGTLCNVLNFNYIPFWYIYAFILTLFTNFIEYGLCAEEIDIKTEPKWTKKSLLSY